MFLAAIASSSPVPRIIDRRRPSLFRWLNKLRLHPTEAVRRYRAPDRPAIDYDHINDALCDERHLPGLECATAYTPPTHRTGGWSCSPVRPAGPSDYGSEG
jgi:hypothetical protein